MITLQSAVDAALTDAARRTGIKRTELEVLIAEPVTWSDGSLGCPQPGMMYTQALVSGFRIRVRAGAETLDYHSGRRGALTFCPAERVVPPVSDNAGLVPFTSVKERFFSDLRGNLSGLTVVTANLLLPHIKTAGGRPWPKRILWPGWAAGKVTSGL